MHRYPERRRHARASGTRSCPSHAPDWLPRWDNPDADPGETQTYLVVDEPAALVWAANFGALEWHAWTSRGRRPAPADVRADRPRPRRRDHAGTTLLVLARLHRTALEHLGVRGAAEGHRPARHPDLGADRAAARASTRPAPGSSSCRGPSARSCPSWSAGSGRSTTAAAWPGSTTPRTRSTRPWSRRTARAPAPGAPVSAPIDWDELDDPDLRPDGFTIRRPAAPRRARRPVPDVLATDQTLPRIS